MAQYRIEWRGAGFAKVIADGFYSERYFSELFDYCPEQLLTQEQRQRLESFLSDVPRLHARRTRKQREEAEELLELIGPVTKGALVQEARDLLLRRIAGATIRAAHRPANRTFSRKSDAWLMAKWIKQSVEICVKEGQPLSVPGLQAVEDDPSWSQLPVATRALQVARKTLANLDITLPGDATVLNRMSEFPDLRHLIVKAREE